MHVVIRRYIQQIQPVAVNALRLWMAVFLARNCIMYAVKYTPASYSTLITLITPVFALGLELIFLGTSPSAVELIIAIPLLELARDQT